MITKAQLKQIITDNLTDIRMSSIQLFLSELISRQTHGSGIDQYRIFNEQTGIHVLDFDGFINELDENNFTYGMSLKSDKVSGELVAPMYVVIENFKVTLDRNSSEDEYLFKMFGDGDRICLYLTYMNDGDESIPLKIFNVKLI